MNNPIFAFSAIRRMRSARTPLLITLYSLLLALLAYFTVYGRFMGATVTLGDMRLSVDGYAYMIMLQFALLVLVAPAMTAGSISGERERQTLDLLLVTNTGAVKLVLGKLLESFGFLALMVMCSLPMLSLVLITGGATFAQVLVSVAFLLLTALAALSVGLVCSSLFQRTVTATVMSYLSVFALGIVTLLPLWHDVKRIGDLYDAMNIVAMDFHEHFDGCTLRSLTYDEAFNTEQLAASGQDPQRTIILMSVFDVCEAGNAAKTLNNGSTYVDYPWVLSQDGAGRWHISGGGYG